MVVTSNLCILLERYSLPKSNYNPNVAKFKASAVYSTMNSRLYSVLYNKI